MYITIMDDVDLHYLSKLRGISLAHINIRSLFRKLEDIIRILTDGDVCVLGISETWLNRSVPDSMIGIGNYDVYRSDRSAASGKSTGGGVCLYVHTKYNTTARDDITVCMQDIEIIWIRLSLKDTRPTYIACVYRPPSGNLEAAFSIVEEHVSLLRSSGNCDIILLGDFNIDTLKPRSPETRKYIEFNKRLLMTPVIKQPTYYNSNYRSSIDDIIVSNTDYYSTNGTVCTGDTDHLLVYTTRKKTKVPSEPCHIFGRTFSKFNAMLFQRDCILANWSSVTSCPNVTEAWDNFLVILHTV